MRGRGVNSTFGRIAVRIAVVALALLAACSRLRSCHRGDVIADLENAQGSTERSEGDLRTWRASPPGDSYVLDDALRTGTRSTARVHLSAGGGLQLAPRTTLRFLAHPRGQRRTAVRVVSGEAVLTAGDEDLYTATSIGFARVEHGARVLVRADDEGQHFEVQIGRVEIDQVNGRPVTVGENGHIVVSIAGAVIESVGESPDAGAPASRDAGTDVSDAGPPTDASTVADPTVHATIVGAGVRMRDSAVAAWRALGPGRVDLLPGIELSVPLRASARLERGEQRETVTGAADVVISAEGDRIAVPPDHADATIEVVPESAQPAESDVEMSAGDSATVHDMAGSTVVRVRVPDVCSEGGRIDVTAGHRTVGYVGSQRATFRVAGAARYRVRCLHHGTPADTDAATGRIHVIRDSGAAAMPRRPPLTMVDADGRHYTVLYQNLLPEISFRWPRAPQGSSFTLHVTSTSGQAQSMAASEPRFFLHSGRLGEGTYRFRVEGPGGARSPETTVQIDFDNAARAAQIREPVEGAPAPGGRAHVAGSALEGATVSANGVSLPLDAQLRFAGDVPVGRGGTVAIRITHRQLGVHTYVRRVGGGAP